MDEPKLDPTNPPIDSNKILPDTFYTHPYNFSKTCNVLGETDEYYIFDNDGKPDVELKEKSRVVSIAVIR